MEGENEDKQNLHQHGPTCGHNAVVHVGPNGEPHLGFLVQGSLKCYQPRKPDNTTSAELETSSKLELDQLCFDSYQQPKCEEPCECESGCGCEPASNCDPSTSHVHLHAHKTQPETGAHGPCFAAEDASAVTLYQCEEECALPPAESLPTTCSHVGVEPSDMDLCCDELKPKLATCVSGTCSTPSAELVLKKPEVSLGKVRHADHYDYAVQCTEGNLHLVHACNEHEHHTDDHGVIPSLKTVLRGPVDLYGRWVNIFRLDPVVRTSWLSPRTSTRSPSQSVSPPMLIHAPAPIVILPGGKVPVLQSPSRMEVSGENDSPSFIVVSSGPSETSPDTPDDSQHQVVGGNEPGLSSTVTVDKEASTHGTTKLLVKGICCAAEIRIIRDELEALAGVESVNTNLVSKTVLVKHDYGITSSDDLAQVLNKKKLNASVLRNAVQKQNSLVTTKLHVKGICCDKVINTVCQALEVLPGVLSVQADVTSKTVLIKHDGEISPPSVLARSLNDRDLDASVLNSLKLGTVTSTGSPIDGQPLLLPSDQDGFGEEQKQLAWYKRFVARYPHWNVVIAFIFWILSLVQYAEGLEDMKYLAIVSICVALPPLLVKSWYSIKRKVLDINALMAIAVVGAIGIGEYSEGAAVVTLFSMGDWLESKATNRARRAIEAIIALKPNYAILAPKGSESGVLDMSTPLVTVPVESVVVGTKLLVRSGDTVPLDGVVVAGESLLDESSLTGESVGVNKAVGDEVSAGTLNSGVGLLTIEATSLSEDSAVSRLVRLVEEAQAQRSPTEQLVERLSKWYTPLVVLIALFLATIPWAWGTEVGAEYLHMSLFLLVVACPCALVISTPISYVCTIAHAARLGVLVKGGKFLETLGKLEVIAMDKTGTLTEGKFQLMSLEPITLPEKVKATASSVEAQKSSWNREWTEEELLSLLLTVEAGSNHPIAVALCAAARERDVNAISCPVDSLNIVKGQGVCAILGSDTDGSTPWLSHAVVGVGNDRMARENGWFGNGSIPSHALQLTELGRTVCWIAVNNVPVAEFSLADRIRDESKGCVELLKHLGVETVMLTGDNQGSADAVAKQVGMTSYFASLLPSDKVAHVEKLKNRNSKGAVDLESNTSTVATSKWCCWNRSRSDRKTVVAMVGDGVNDAPALAGADVGIAMGAMGTAVAMETADVALMDSDLRKIAKVVRLGKRCIRKITENVTLSLASKLLMLILVFCGYDQLWIAIASDVGTMLIVTLNAMTLLGKPRSLSKPTKSTPAMLRDAGPKSKQVPTAKERKLETPEESCQKGCCDAPAAVVKEESCQKGCCDVPAAVVKEESCQKGCCDAPAAVVNEESCQKGCCDAPAAVVKEESCQKGCCDESAAVVKEESCQKGCCDEPAAVVKEESCQKGCCDEPAAVVKEESCQKGCCDESATTAKEDDCQKGCCDEPAITTKADDCQKGCCDEPAAVVKEESCQKGCCDAPVQEESG